VNDGDVVGIEVIDELGAHSTLYADAVILASGGAGQLFRHTTNPLVTTGDGVAAAWRAGAQLADLEFYQFHPTTLAGSGNFLVSEAVRGEGAVLRNRAGVRFMLDVHPDAELAPRDVVARAIAVEMAAQDGEAVTLDATELGREFLSRRFPTIDAACTRVGLDWATVQVPVTPAAHYWMGGIATDINGRTSLPRLYAVGEAACTGAHGANRLASNSLLESLVFGHRASRDLDRFSSDSWSTSVVEDSADPAVNVAFADAPDGVTVDRATLQNLMWECAGVHRSETTLGSAARSLNGLRAERGPGASVGEREDANLLDLGRLIVAAALSREESRGAHFRSDFPMVSAAAPFHHAWSRKVSVPC
jgi:L-aspartate oxidase